MSVSKSQVLGIELFHVLDHLPAQAPDLAQEEHRELLHRRLLNALGPTWPRALLSPHDAEQQLLASLPAIDPKEDQIFYELLVRTAANDQLAPRAPSGPAPARTRAPRPAATSGPTDVGPTEHVIDASSPSGPRPPEKHDGHRNDRGVNSCGLALLAFVDTLEDLPLARRGQWKSAVRALFRLPQAPKALAGSNMDEFAAKARTIRLGTTSAASMRKYVSHLEQVLKRYDDAHPGVLQVTRTLRPEPRPSEAGVELLSFLDAAVQVGRLRLAQAKPLQTAVKVVTTHAPSIDDVDNIELDDLASAWGITSESALMYRRQTGTAQRLLGEVCGIPFAGQLPHNALHLAPSLPPSQRTDEISLR